MREVKDRSARRWIERIDRDGPAERHERPAAVADGESHHFRQLTAERALPPLDLLSRENVIFQHQIVRNRSRQKHEVLNIGMQRRAEQADLARLQFAAITAPALWIEKEIVLVEQLAHICLERDEIGGI